MGNSAIIIRCVGGHQNGSTSDAEQIAKRCVDELRAHGHNVLSASVETGGCSIELAPSPSANLRGFDIKDGRFTPINMPDWRIHNPELPAQMAYERYIHASGGKSLVSGAELPGWAALSPEIKTAWMAAVDHTKPGLAR